MTIAIDMPAWLVVVAIFAVVFIAAMRYDAARLQRDEALYRKHAM